MYPTFERDKTEGNDKYLVVSPDSTCGLRKLTASQSHSKVYAVPLSQCFPVLPTALTQSPLGLTRGQSQNSHSDSAEDCIVFPLCHTCIQDPVPNTELGSLYNHRLHCLLYHPCSPNRSACSQGHWSHVNYPSTSRTIILTGYTNLPSAPVLDNSSVLVTSCSDSHYCLK